MNSQLKKMICIISELIVLQVFLTFWQMALRHFNGNGDKFISKMITMSGMMILTVAIAAFSKKRNSMLSFLPEKFSRNYWIATFAAVLFLIATPSNYIDGIRDPILTLYASIVTLLYEELLFRGYVWNQLESIYESCNRIIWVNAFLG